MIMLRAFDCSRQPRAEVLPGLEASNGFSAPLVFGCYSTVTLKGHANESIKLLIFFYKQEGGRPPYCCYCIMLYTVGTMVLVDSDRPSL